MEFTAQSLNSSTSYPEKSISYMASSATSSSNSNVILNPIWPMNQMSAESACRALGTRWKVTRIFDGSLICSTIEWTKNCHNCNTWRLLVWTNGSTDRFRSQTNPCLRNKTLEGHYYCGHNPCSKCGELSPGGRWIQGIYK